MGLGHKTGPVQVRTALETVTPLPELMFVIVLDSSTIASTIHRLPEICSLDFSDSFGLAAQYLAQSKHVVRAAKSSGQLDSCYPNMLRANNHEMRIEEPFDSYSRSQY